MKKSVIVNPSAGWGSAGRKWPELESRLKSLHGEFETHFTRGPGDAVQITRRLLLSGTERLFVVGGDGTVNEAVTGLVRSERLDIPVGLVPSGTVNLLASELGFSKSVEPIVDAMTKGTRRSLYLGQITSEVENRIFLVTNQHLLFSKQLFSSLVP